MLAALLTLRIFQYFLMPLMSGHAPLYSWQLEYPPSCRARRILFQCWAKATDALHLALAGHFDLLIELAQHTLRLVAPEMAPTALQAHNLARAGHAKPLGRGLVSLDLGHRTITSSS